MKSSAESPVTQLSQEYDLRFSGLARYRQQVWKILTRRYFQQYISPEATLLDLGCGWGEFSNNVRASHQYAMDLNPDAAQYLHAHIDFIHQDCSKTWPLSSDSLDVVFTSNFLEHLPNKSSLLDTLREARRCLRPGGLIICLGPNIKYVGGAYWDFLDHYIPLTDASMAEALQLSGFEVNKNLPRFLPYTMSGGSQPPLWCISAYLSMPFVWPILGRQFLLVARNGE